jgi:hypothetical protein
MQVATDIAQRVVCQLILLSKSLAVYGKRILDVVIVMIVLIYHKQNNGTRSFKSVLVLLINFMSLYSTRNLPQNNSEEIFKP